MEKALEMETRWSQLSLHMYMSAMSGNKIDV